MFLRQRAAFTFIEIIIIITILGVIAALISGNFFSSLRKGRDARRKADLQQIQQALEMYYEDKKTYPTFSFPFGNKFCETVSCLAGEKIYMERVPNDPISQNIYFYQSDGNYYRLYSCLENPLDQGPGIRQEGYLGTNCGSCGLCKFQISSYNVSPN